MNGSNIKINIKGRLQAEGKWSQMEAWIFRKERRAIEREIWINTNESWLYKTIQLMFKIREKIKIHNTIAHESGSG